MIFLWLNIISLKFPQNSRIPENVCLTLSNTNPSKTNCPWGKWCCALDFTRGGGEECLRGKPFTPEIVQW